MNHYSKLAWQLKREILHFCKKLSHGFHRPIQKFIADMVFGLLSANSSFLSEIARALKETIALDKTVERLSRNLMNFDGAAELHEHYLNTVMPSFDERTVLIIDDSDIAKPYSSKLEGVCKVRDGSTGKITDGYWVAGVSALTAEHKQPIPVYSHIYSSEEEGYISNNAETLKALEFLSSHFPKTNIRALDRGYDAGYVFDYFILRDEHFITRIKDNRNLTHKGKTVLVRDIIKSFSGKYALKFETKSGKSANCKISMIPVCLPKHTEYALNLVIVRGLGKDPLILLTNLSHDDNRLCVTIAKVYLMRWRIEEYYRFKKQGFNFEKFLVRSLKSIRNLDLLLTVAIGFIGMLSEKINESIVVREVIEASKRLYGVATFMFYAISDGLENLFAKSYTGIYSFFRKPQPSMQIMFADW